METVIGLVEMSFEFFFGTRKKKNFVRISFMGC